MSQTPAVDASDLAVKVIRQDMRTVVRIGGELDLVGCEALRAVLTPHMTPGARLSLDLADVTFMDSTCLAVLIEARNSLTDTGGSLALRNPSRATTRLLEVSGTADLFEVER